MSNYPQEWLNSNGCNFIWTNAEILEMSEKERLSNQFIQDWFNPFEEPQKLNELRLSMGLKPTEWKYYIIENFPGINAKEEYEKRKEEVKQHRIENCGMVGKWKWNPETFSKVWIPHFCKSPDCPKCAAKLERGHLERMENLLGKTVIKMSVDDEQSFKRNLTKEDYVRVPLENNEVAFVLNRKPENGEIALSYSDAVELSKRMVSTEHGRVSGNLGKQSTVEQLEDEPVEVEQDITIDLDAEIEMSYDVKLAVFDIDFSNNKLTPSELERLVLQRLEVDHTKESFDNLQYIVYQLQELTKAVCEEYGIVILFLYTEYKTIQLKDVKWQNLLRYKNKEQIEV